MNIADLFDGGGKTDVYPEGKYFKS